MSIGVANRGKHGISSAVLPQFKAIVAGVAGLVALAGCTVGQVADLENPVARRLNWFAYLDGADIRPTCGPGSDDRARMVLNGRYEDQVRTYELRQRGGAPVLESHVFTGLQLSSTGLDSLADALQGRPREERIGQAGAEALWDALRESGAFGRAPEMRLHSNDIYWIATGCRNGEPFFNAWRQSTPRFAALTFPEVLQRLEGNDVPWPNLQRGPDLARQAEIERGMRPDFLVHVTPQGVRR